MGFYGSNDPTNSVKALKEVVVLMTDIILITRNSDWPAQVI